MKYKILYTLATAAWLAAGMWSMWFFRPEPQRWFLLLPLTVAYIAGMLTIKETRRPTK